MRERSERKAVEEETGLREEEGEGPGGGGRARSGMGGMERR